MIPSAGNVTTVEKRRSALGTSANYSSISGNAGAKAAAPMIVSMDALRMTMSFNVSYSIF